MICEYKNHCSAASILLAAFLVSGCATTTTSLKFTQAELKLVPVVAFQKVLSSGAMNETVEVNARSIDRTAVVKGFEGQNYVIVTDKRGQEIRLSISEITEVERIRRIKRSDTSSKNGESNTAEAVGETLIYAPLVPVAIAMWPALRASGLDAGKNAEDNRKARLVYEGMSKEALKTYVGEPKEKYYCEAKGRSKAHEVWVFEEDKVLRGGRALFVDLESDKVYHNSYHISFFKDDCTLMTQ
jgi:CRISPR/Cas system CMR subunit Cmr4 (Cas7 group RAMP superfamily)